MTTKPDQSGKRTKGPTTARSGKGPGAILMVVAVVVAAAAVAALVWGGGDDAGTSDGARIGDSAGPVETATVTVDGSTLPLLTAEGDTAIAMAAPALTGVGFDGRSVVVDPAAQEQATLLVFGAHWCPHCQREFPKLAEWMRSDAYDPELRVVAVVTATSKDRPNYPPSSWLDGINWPGDVLVDDASSTAAVAYGVGAFPFVVLVDQDGTVLARSAGAVDDIDAFAGAVR